MTTIYAPGGTTVNISQNGTTLTYIVENVSNTIDMTSLSQLPVTIFNSTQVGMLTIQFQTSINITNATSGFYFNIGSPYITIDGSVYSVNFNNVTNYPGLIQNTSYSNITIQNITTVDTGSTPSTLATSGGWVCRSFFGLNSSFITVTNCTNNCNVNGFNGGGIVGIYFCQNGSNCTIQNCINNGSLNGNYATDVGGIAGSSCFISTYQSNNVIESCINNGTLIGSYVSGIAGPSFGVGTHGGGTNATIQGCTNNGRIINGSYSGGIIGVYSFASISNCYTLYGFIAGTSANVTISNCYVANGTSNNGNPTVVGNGTWSSTDAASSLILPTSTGSYYWLYTTTTTNGTPSNTTPFLIASLNLNNRNYVTSSTQFTTSQQSVTLALPVTVTKSSKSKAKTTTTTYTSAGSSRLDVGSTDNVQTGDKVFIRDTKTGSYEIGNVRARGSIYLNGPLKNSYSAGSQIYIYPSYISDSDIYAEQNLPIPIADICFLRSTPIETDQGIISIQKIDPSLHTINNKKIITITKSVTEDKFLICFEKHSLGENIPSARTIVSKYHKIQNRKGKMMDAYKFLDYYEDVKKIDYDGDILYNILMDDHETVNVNNLVCETLHPDHEIAKLYKNNYSEEYTDTVIAFMNYSKKVSTFRKG
jgi:hypothetical protein